MVKYIFISGPPPAKKTRAFSGGYPLAQSATCAITESTPFAQMLSGRLLLQSVSGNHGLPQTETAISRRHHRMCEHLKSIFP